MTGYTVEEFEALLPTFQAEFEAYVSEYCLDGTKRKKRKYVEYKNSPLPTIADKLLFILVYLKQVLYKRHTLPYSRCTNLMPIAGYIFCTHCSIRPWLVWQKYQPEQQRS